MNDNKLRLSVLAILIAGCIVHEMKLPCFYDEYGKFREFGVKNDQTIIVLNNVKRGRFLNIDRLIELIN